MQPVVNYDHKTIQVRRGTTTEWRRYGAICVPAEGEICVEFFQDSDGSRNGNTGMKIGNGTSNYTDLPYLITNQNQDDRISDDQINNWDLTVEKLANLVASEVAQSNSALGDNVQEALDDLHGRLLAIDPDGGSIEINDIPGLGDALNDKADKSALEKEIQDRKDGDKSLQDQIDALDPNANGDVDWSDIENKPTEFPPEAHNQGWDTITGKPADYPPSAHDHAWSEITGKPSEFPPESHGHEIADVDGLQDALDSAGGTPAWDDVTGKPTEFPPEAHNQDWSTITNTPSDYPPEDHTHGQDEVDGLELRLEAIEDSITSGGGFVDAPNDGQLYGRQSEAWSVVPAGGASSWNDLTDKPADFPPSDHTHEIDEVNGLQDALDAAGGTPAWDDVTGKPTEFPPEAHQHGWDDVTGKPADYPPSAHNHDGVYQPVGEYIGEAPNDGEEYARKNQGWVKLQDHNYTGADAVKITGDQTVAGHKTWTGVATFGDTVTMRGTLNGDDTANFQNAVTAGSFVKTGGTSSEYLMADGSVSAGAGGDGELVHIGEAPPADPQEGQQWMEVPADGDATMWIYDGGKWLQHPGGKDGAAGADGADGNIADAAEDSVIATWSNADGQWTPESKLKVGSWGMSLTGNQYIAAANPDNAGGFTRYSNTSGSMQVGMAGETANKLLIYDAKEDQNAAIYAGGASGGWEFWTNNQERMTINGNGDVSFKNATMSQSSTAVQAYFIQSNNAGCTLYSGVDGADTGLFGTSTGHSIAFMTNNVKHMTMDVNGRVDITGSLYVNGTPKIGTDHLIKTFSKLRDAIKDEETVESLKESITNCIGGLIEEWESMQSTATQEIES